MLVADFTLPGAKKQQESEYHRKILPGTLNVFKEQLHHEIAQGPNKSSFVIWFLDINTWIRKPYVVNPVIYSSVNIYRRCSTIQKTIVLIDFCFIQLNDTKFSP